MFRIQTGRHELCSISDHHQKNLFAFLVDTGNLVKINDTVLSRLTISICAPTGGQFVQEGPGQIGLEVPIVAPSRSRLH